MDTTAMGSPDANLSQSAEDRRSDTGDNGGKLGWTKIASFFKVLWVYSIILSLCNFGKCTYVYFYTYLCSEQNLYCTNYYQGNIVFDKRKNYLS